MLRSHLSCEGSEKEKQTENRELRYKHPLEHIPQRTSPFYNWGQTIKIQPYRIFYPKTKNDVCKIIKWAKSDGKRVRVSAYKHSWANLFAQNNDILISLLDYEQAEILPSIHKPLGNYTPFQHIALIGNSFQENGKTKHLCKIGAATSNEQFRSWAIADFKQKGSLCSWTVPFNVILVENTFGGTNSMMCHGAGLKNQTLSDLVTEIEFINPIGELQSIGYKLTDSLEIQAEGRELIKSAAGSLGQLGVVTELTLKLDQMTHARMNPRKQRVALAIPPPEGFIFPQFLPPEIMKGVTEKELRLAKVDFVNRCENDYYSEWFWFSLHNNCYTNSWKNDGNENISQLTPSPFEAKLQEVELYLANLANSTILKMLPPVWQTLLLSDAAMLSLSAHEEVVAPLTDALHFRRGIHNMPVQNMEFHIPIPALPNGKPDWSICQKAWWDAIVIVYECLVKKNKVPMRLPLEMRIMGGSDITMAPQKGNQYGTCSIEVLTLGTDIIDKDEWHEFMQAIIDKWSSYTDTQGKPLNIRPHWAKQWKGLTIQRPGEQRLEIIDYIKEIYKDEIPIFNRDMARIAEKGGYTASDFSLFSSPLLDRIFHGKDTPEMIAAESSTRADPPPCTNEELLKNAPSIHELILKAQNAHKAKQNFLSGKYKKPLRGNKSKELMEDIRPAGINPRESLLAINNWFSKARLVEQERELLLENTLQEKAQESACCSCPLM